MEENYELPITNYERGLADATSHMVLSYFVIRN